MMITPLPPSPGELSLIEIVALAMVVSATIQATIWYKNRKTLHFALMVAQFLMLFLVVCS